MHGSRAAEKSQDNGTLTHKHQHGSETPGNLFPVVEKVMYRPMLQEISQQRFNITNIWLSA